MDSFTRAFFKGDDEDDAAANDRKKQEFIASTQYVRAPSAAFKVEPISYISSVFASTSVAKLSW
jgi:hypothetical protein